MSAGRDGGPAFPTLAVIGDHAVSEGGLTLRDYFAAKAMQGLLANQGGQLETTVFEYGDKAALARLARFAGMIADAMLADSDQAGGDGPGEEDGPWAPGWE